jgi:hypothetical protein
MTKTDIGFFAEIACDDCGRIGAYDVDGDYLCTYCLNAVVDAAELFDEEPYYEEDKGYC